jgi:predicted transcriptional regulator
VASWNFLTNHFLVLAQISQQADSTGREIAEAIGITERAVRDIVVDLQAGGYVELERVGRRNRYRVNSDHLLGRSGSSEAATVGDLLGLLRT